MSTSRYFKISESIHFGFAIIFGTAGLLYLASRVAPAHSSIDGFDLRILWIAGKLWLSGQDPYGGAFNAEYLRTFGAIPAMHFLVYPPYWFPIAAPLSLLSFQTACIVWRLINLVVLLAATFLATSVFVTKNVTRFGTIFLVGLGFSSLMQSNAFSLLFCQTSSLLYFGLAAVFYGLSRGNHWAFASGLIAVALKPNVGAVVYVLIATMMPEQRKTLIVAILLLLLAAMPVLIHEPSDTLAGFLANLARYYGFQLPANAPHGTVESALVHVRSENWAQLVANAPPNMIGVFHFTNAIPISSTTIANILIAAAAAVSLIVWRLEGSNELKFVRITLAILWLVPLHYYDMTMLAIPAIFILSLGTSDPRVWPALLGLFICFRAASVSGILGISEESLLPGSTPATAGLVLVTIPFLISATSSKATRYFQKLSPPKMS